MRWFIGTLIAVNLAILLWGWLGTDERPNGKLAAPGVGSIRLVGETATAQEPVAVPIPAPPRSDGVMPETALPLPPQAVEPDAVPVASTQPAAALADAADTAQAVESEPAIAVVEPAPTPAPAAPALHCRRIGPFEDAAAAKASRAFLKTHGDVDNREETVQITVGNWVLIPPQSNRAAAEAVGARLKAKGINDFWIISKGALQNAISLGVFSQKDNADAFAQRARAMGFDVTIRDKTKAGKALWLEYRGKQAVTAGSLGDRVPAGVKVVAQDCP